ncbi:MAG: hypothetical protein LBF22_02510, partial [Deltaproteobacteria bacterium]|nr:hypothetical protein [Deltaproteobacteria bacterium]
MSLWPKVKIFLAKESVADAICKLTIGFVLSFMVYIIMLNANFKLGDYLLFLQNTGRGLPNFAWTGMGRFFPFGFLDFNILLYFPYGYTVNAHYFLCAGVFVLSALTLWRLFAP